MVTWIVGLCLVTADPMTPEELDRALQVPLSGAEARALAGRIRASFPAEKDLTRGGHLVDRGAVAFAIAAGADARPRVEGMVNHSRGLDLVPIGSTGLWARVEPIPPDTKFSYHFTVNGRKQGGAVVAMPGWSYPPESVAKPGVAYGRYEPLRFRSRIFQNDRTGWIYVPAAYDGREPASLMVFQDGDAYKAEHVGTVVENLIAARRMPVTILVLLNPGRNGDGTSNRGVEYDILSDRYATFLIDEALPLVSKSYAIATDPDRHAIGGAASGGVCAFTVAWHRPDQFRRVLSQIGSFTNIRGGHLYPDLVRREPARPIRVLLTDGTNDLINEHGDWWQANSAMSAALKAKGYQVRFQTDRGFHACWTCGRQLPEALAWLWADEAK